MDILIFCYIKYEPYCYVIGIFIILLFSIIMLNDDDDNHCDYEI